MTLRRLRVGLIGAGDYAVSYHLVHCVDNPDVEVRAISDISEPRRATAARLSDVDTGHMYADYARMIAAEELDAVIVSTPHSLHAEHVRTALQAGLHVLVDKPFVLRSEEARELIDLASTQDRVLMVGLNRHLDAANLYVRQVIGDGALGRVYLVRTLQVGKPTSGFFGNPRLAGGGPLVSRGSHMAALVTWLTGWRPSSVTAMIVQRLGEKIDDGGLISVAFDGDQLAQLTAVQAGSRYVDECEVVGTGGRMLIERPAVGTDWRVRRQETSGWVDCDDMPSGSNTTDHFVRVVRGEVISSVSIMDAYYSVQIIEAAYKAATLGSLVSLSSAAPIAP